MTTIDHTGFHHFMLRPRRTHRTFTKRCSCGWESQPVPHHTKGDTQGSDHLERVKEWS